MGRTGTKPPGRKAEGITLDKAKARERFNAALTLARSTSALPEEWLERTRVISASKSKTFTAALGTALLAKATDRRIDDALSLQASSSHKGYSARSIAKEVLVPCCAHAGVDLRNAGAEPLNNQPFFGEKQIGTQLKVKDNVRSDLNYLIDALKKADFLENEDALGAFAAFLRARLAASAQPVRVKVAGTGLTYPTALAAIEQFVGGPAEGGRVGQAVVAAILGLVYPTVRTKRINDPSRRWAGDVGVFAGTTLTLSCEVKQRAVSDTELSQLAQRLSKTGITRGLMVVLSADTFPFETEIALSRAWDLYGVALRLVSSARTLLDDALWHRAEPLEQTLAALPAAVMTRLEELDVSLPRRRAWATLTGPQLP